MALSYGQKAYKISTSNISAINLTSCTLTTSSDTASGSGIWEFSHSNVACGSTGFNLIINDATIPTLWSNISWKTWIGFTSSCWSFANANNQYGTGSHNILSFSTASGDLVSKYKNSWEIPTYTLKMAACDNNADNFIHQSYATGTFRYWHMKRRRDGTNTAGPAAGFACTSGGTCIISDVFVW